MSEQFHQFETIRHSHKKGEDLSELGRQMAEEKAEEYAEQIRNFPPGTIFYIQASNIGRAQETKDIIESKLRELCKDEAEFVSIGEVEKIGAIKDGDQNKYVITDLAESPLLGFVKKTPGQESFSRYRKMYHDDEDLVGETWAARTEEIPRLREKVKGKFPEIDADTIHPKDFISTPEYIAIRYLRVMKAMNEITNKHFPGHSWKALQVGHNVSADFAAIALLGKDISVASYDELGSKFRDFLESAYFDIKDDKIVSSYRGQTVELEKDLATLISELEQKSEERKKEWN